MNNDKDNDIKQVPPVKPQWIPYKCSNCGGYGTYGRDRILCQSCQGTGIIKVPVQTEKQ